MATKRTTASTAESRFKVQRDPATSPQRHPQTKTGNVHPTANQKANTPSRNEHPGAIKASSKSAATGQKTGAPTRKTDPVSDSNSKPRSKIRRGSLEEQIAKPPPGYSQFASQRRNSRNSDKETSPDGQPTRAANDLQRRRASDPGPERKAAPQSERRTSLGQQRRRASDLGVLFRAPGSSSSRRSSVVSEPDEPEPRYTEVHCTWCQRRGRRTKGHFYCHDCNIGLCEACAKEHVKDVTMNRHSVSVISKTYSLSPNQGPFPNITQIGSIKLDQEITIRGSAFLPNGVLLIGDYSNSKIRMFTGDYTRKHLASLNLQKEKAWDESRPKPLDLADISTERFAFTTNTGCVYVANVGVSMLMKIERIITVIRFESNYGECLGIAFNDADDGLYVGCTSDRDGTYFNVYGLDGVQRRTVRNSVTDIPEYLAFGPDKTKLFAADSDSVTVYNVRDFR